MTNNLEEIQLIEKYKKDQIALYYVPPKRPNVSGSKLKVMGDWIQTRVEYPGLGETAREMYNDYKEFVDLISNQGNEELSVSYKLFTDTFLFVAHNLFSWVKTEKNNNTRHLVITNVMLRYRSWNRSNTPLSNL